MSNQQIPGIPHPETLVEVRKTYQPLRDLCDGELMDQNMLWIQNRVFWIVRVAVDKYISFLERHFDELKQLVHKYEKVTDDHAIRKA